VREFATPLVSDVADSATLLDDVEANAREHPDAVSFSRRAGETWEDVTAGEFLVQVRALAKGFVAAGMAHGDRVALMAKTRYEWTLVDYAVWYAGGVTVPIYVTSAPDMVDWLLADSGARFAVVEQSAHAARLTEPAGRAAVVESIWTIEPDADGAADIAGLVARGESASDAGLDERRTAVTADDVATIVYTSGTTGRPKGCVLTHRNFLVELEGTTAELHELFESDDAATLLFLPLPHVFARIVQVGAVKNRVRLGHTADVRHLVDDLESFAPTFVLAVPRMFEKIFNTASQRATVDGRGRMFDRATDVAIAYSRALDDGRPGPVLRAQHRVLDRLVYQRLRASLGGRCRWAISGGAPLGERLGHFFRGIGIPVLEGYGLTETAGAVTVNLPDAMRIGTVGRPVPGATVRVSDDGELLIAGDLVFRGYWGDEAATAEVLGEAGWLHTGDLGEIDEEGFVRVTGRRKEILVTSGGKNVAPAVLEDRIRAHPLVSQCMVVGDGRPYVAALVTLDPDAFAVWRSQRDKHGDLAALATDPDLVADVQQAVDGANTAVSRAESIRRFAILSVDWTEESGELTPSLKVRRNLVMREFRREIADLYD